MSNSIRVLITNTRQKLQDKKTVTTITNGKWVPIWLPGENWMNGWVFSFSNSWGSSKGSLSVSDAKRSVTGKMIAGLCCISCVPQSAKGAQTSVNIRQGGFYISTKYRHYKLKSHSSATYTTYTHTKTHNDAVWLTAEWLTNNVTTRRTCLPSSNFIKYLLKVFWERSR